MKKASTTLKKQVVKDLKKHVKKLQSDLTKAKKHSAIAGHIQLKVQKSQARFKRIKNREGRDRGIGDFFLLMDITAPKEAIYIPLSIASGKRATGFVYHIEGTAEGTISTTDISVRGIGTTQITLGTLLYCKIPAGKTATFRILIEMKGKAGKTYKVVINRINYKLNPTDARYVRYEKEISSKTLRFS